MGKFKKIVATLLIMGLSLQQVGLSTKAYTLNNTENNLNITNTTTDKKISYNEDTEKNDESKSKNLFEEKEKVRVIVELEQKSIVDEAIEKGVDYKELDKSFIEEKTEEIKKEQKDIVKNIDDKVESSDISSLRQYDTIINGVSFSVDKKDIQNIENIQGVKNVYVSEEFERPLLKSSTNMIGASSVWSDLGYKGEGTVVAVVDSGIDFSHKAFKLDDMQKAALNSNKVSDIISTNNLRGKYYSEKVPYGYNYYDYNYNLFDSYGVMHGMHVSGIVGANDSEKNIYGVAPNSQILAMKVFSDDLQYPTTFTDIWLKAVNDAIILKADVINMSLGSPAGFSIEGRTYPEREMLEKARAAGIVVAVAAGNDATITEGNSYNVKPLKENYDTALIANPALDESTIAVASMENDFRQVNTIVWNGLRGGVNTEIVDVYAPSGTNDVVMKSLFYVTQEQAIDSSIKNTIKDKFVLLEMPDNKNKMENFKKKFEEIVQSNPKAIFLGNSVEMGEKLGASLESIGSSANTIIVRVKRSTFDKITKANSGYINRVMLNVKPISFASADKGKMSKFSSWGPTPDLRIKPEITAVGGYVNSTTEDQKYKNMSGTSMASPHIAGASAIVKQYIKEKNIQVENSSDFIKLLLMNTAKPVEDMSSGVATPYFVRQQGSGLINLENALKTEVVVRATGTNDDVADGKLELKQIDSKKFIAHLSLTNFGDKEKTYKVTSKAIYEPTEIVREGEKELVYRTQKSKILTSSQDLKSEDIKVEPKSTKDIDITFDYEDASELEENNYLEGFIKLADLEGEADLNIPFLGFYGEWNTQNAIDAFDINEENSSGRNVQFYVNKDNNMRSSMFVNRQMVPTPVVDNTLYISPDSVYYNEVGVRLAPLRNMESIEYSILDADTNEVLRVVGESQNVKKLSRLGRGKSFVPMPDSIWDGKLDGKFAEEGKTYIYQLKAKLNSHGIGGEGVQTYRFPLRVDKTKPVFGTEGIKIEDRGNREKRITFKIQDTSTGIDKIYLQSMKFVKSGEGATPPAAMNSAENTSSLENVEDTNDINNIENIDNIESIENINNIENTSGVEDVNSKVQGNIKGTPKYGKSILIDFVDIPSKDGKELIKVENGKLIIPDSEITKTAAESKTIYVYRNNFRNEEIEVVAPFYADSTHVYVYARDYTGNSDFKILETGEKEDYRVLVFMNFYNSIQAKKMEVSVNDTKLNAYTYETTDNKAKISLKHFDDKDHINLLYLKRGRNITYLIRDDVVSSDAKKYAYKYDKETKTVEFTIDPLLTNYEIWLGFGNGSMPETTPETDIDIDLSQIPFDDFKQIRLGRDLQNVDSSNPKIRTKSGLGKLEFVFKTMPGKKVKKVVLDEDGTITELKKLLSVFDVEEGKIGYYASGYSINLAYNFKTDTKISIEYDDTQRSNISNEQLEDDIERGILDENGNKQKKSDSNLSGSLEDEEDKIRDNATSSNAGDENNTNNTKDKYPAVYILSPGLLDVLTINNTENSTLLVKGFVGHVGSDDEIDSINIAMLDNDGNEIGKKIEISGSELKREFTNQTNLYAGEAYFFKANLPLDAYNVNIRAEVTTKKGKYASIVRRAFYDKFAPELEYQVVDRELDSEYVIVKARFYDESLKLKLYNGDSLVAVINKTDSTLLNGGVSGEKEVKIKLKKGQNTIRLKAVDLANYTSERKINIFRTN